MIHHPFPRHLLIGLSIAAVALAGGRLLAAEAKVTVD